MSQPSSSSRTTLAELSGADDFARRHIGPDADERAQMLAVLGMDSIDALLDAAVPASIRMRESLTLPAGRTEVDVLAELRAIAGRNRVLTSLIGMGYYGTITPPVILRNLLENPAWYTAYTPYQPEISQGRLEALLNFQTLVTDLTAMDLANASLLDEATAAAEAMAMAHRLSKSGSDVFLVDSDTHPQTVAVLRTRAEPIGVKVVVVESDVLAEGADPGRDAFGVLLSYPGSSGHVRDWRATVERVQAGSGVVVVATDLLALVLLEAPGAWGADIVVGSSQRFGVPLGFGGPHAAFLATREAFARSLPGRLVGVSEDTKGRPALRLALQTREQHIRRERATSNICTAQVLLANIAGMYAVWHGPKGLRRIARRVHRQTAILAAGLRGGGLDVVHDAFFDTLTVRVPGAAAAVGVAARRLGLNLREVDADTLGISLDETTTPAVVAAVWSAFGVAASPSDVEALDATTPDALPPALLRTGELLAHPVFHRYHSEHELLRYLRRLADRDLALDRTMIPLGSCTMKLNAAVEMLPITWPELADIHPYVPDDQAEGYLELIRQLETMLEACTGYDAVSLQPNAGSQGELAGLLAIRAYHRSRGEDSRTVCLIPSSAHGTNAASAVMAGMAVQVVACDDSGNVDLDDLRAKVDVAGDQLAAVMVTYPSTHGVFEEGITELCDIVHAGGGQVYVDGANLNALVGLAQPGRFGADVSHLNLHKTFCIPHGGGGPGVGPVAARAHLAPFLPAHPLHAEGAPVGPVAAAPFGSAGILAISWVYISLMGAAGLRDATGVAVLNANYVAKRLDPHYPVLYTGAGGYVAHECILDLRPLTKATGVSAEDVAKRLIDYGFHAPTLSFPVAGTLMVEPTESEDLLELDRFCDAMIAIKGEIDRVGRGDWTLETSPLRNAPHPAEDVATEDWKLPYTRDVAAFPVPGLRGSKYFPPVSRIDSAYGDRNLMCSCPPIEDFATTAG
jgi:glycine dehydrogenase